jgi:ATP-binding cassette, subfamily B, bacterial PglK
MTSSTFSALSKMWALMEPRERKMAIPVLLLMLASGFASVAMVGAVIGLLYVAAHTDLLTSDPRLLWLRGFVSSEEQVLYVLGGATVLMVVLSTVLGILKIYVMSRYTAMRAFSLSSRMLKLQLHQPYADVAATTLSTSSRRVIREPNEAVVGYLMPLGEAVASAISVVAMLVFLLWFNWLVTVVLVGLFGCVYGGVYALTRSRLRRAGDARIAAASVRSQTFNEVMRCFREVRMSAQEEDFHARFKAATGLEFRSRITVEVLSKFPRYVMQAVIFAVVGMAAVALVVQGGVDGALLISYLPTVGLFMLAGRRMIPDVQNVFSAVGRMIYNTPSVHAVHDAHTLLVSRALTSTPAPSMGLRTDIVLDNISHVYPDRDTGALDGLSLTIPKGQRLGLVGPSGSGKSTLVSILMGLMPPSHGQIRVDGVPLGDNPVGWRLSVAQVPQDVVLVVGTVRANVALGEDAGKVDDARVRAALRAAHLESLVDALPEGLDTGVMSGMVALSGGQRQRLGLARAFYRNADVLVLDEATSALDEATEAAILSEIDAATEGKTVISVAHRLGTLRNCDRIVALDAGRIVFDGDWPAFRAWKEMG